MNLANVDKVLKAMQVACMIELTLAKCTLFDPSSYDATIELAAKCGMKMQKGAMIQLSLFCIFQIFQLYFIDEDRLRLNECGQ
jgi:hypothetical protein